jgi:hypothetical protein
MKQRIIQFYCFPLMAINVYTRYNLWGCINITWMSGWVCLRGREKLSQLRHANYMELCAKQIWYAQTNFEILLFYSEPPETTSTFVICIKMESVYRNDEFIYKRHNEIFLNENMQNKFIIMRKKMTQSILIQRSIANENLSHKLNSRAVFSTNSSIHSFILSVRFSIISNIFSHYSRHRQRYQHWQRQ